MSEADQQSFQENVLDPVNDATGVGEGNFFEQVGDALVSTATQIATGGLVKYQGRKDGKSAGFRPGYTARAIDEGLGEVTGRNVAREAQNDAREAAKEEKKQKELDIANERTKRQQEDLAASRRAYSVRATASAQRRNLLGNDSGRDFLGL